MATDSPVLSVFVLNGCGTCEDVIRDLPQWIEQLGGAATEVFSPPVAAGIPVPRWFDICIPDPGEVVARSRGVTLYPTLLLSGWPGDIGPRRATGYMAIRELILEAQRDLRHRAWQRRPFVWMSRSRGWERQV